MSGHVHRQMQDQLSVAHFVAGPRSQELRCSRAHCASGVVLGFSISVPCLSQSHRTSDLSLASQHAVAADVVQILQEAGWPVWRRAHADAGGPNMKVDRIGTLSNSYVCTRCLRARHLENGNFLRKTPLVSEKLGRLPR